MDFSIRKYFLKFLSYTKLVFFSVNMSLCVTIVLLSCYLTGCGPSINSEDPDERRAAAERITDQAKLAKLAFEHEELFIRYIAIEKLTNQALLAKLAVEDLDSDARKIAVGNLTDQTLLSTIAIKDKKEDVRKAAFEKVTLQVLIAKVAVESRDYEIRRSAVEKLSDETVLADIAKNDKNSYIREIAVKKFPEVHQLRKIVLANEKDVKLQKDQFHLAEIAKIAIDSEVRQAAIHRLNDQKTLLNISLNDEDNDARWTAINMLKDQSFLLKVALSGKNSEDAFKKITTQVLPVEILSKLGQLIHSPLLRIKLSIMEPCIQSRLPGLRCITHIEPTSKLYQYRDWNLGLNIKAGDKLTIKGERVTVTLSQNDKTVIDMYWSTDFPISKTLSLSPTSLITESDFIAAPVSIKDILKKLLHLKIFSQEDLAALCHSSIWEVRYGAVLNLTDQTLLEKIKLKDQDSSVSAAARKRIAELGKVDYQ